jgi:ATP-binding cassette subfamily B multidrug efflux pump
MSSNLPGRAPREMPPIMGRGGPPMGHLMGKAEPAKDLRGTLLRLWRYLRRQRAALLATAVIVVLNTGLTVLGPYLLGVAIDEALTPGDLPLLARVGALMLGVYALSALLTWAQTFIMAGAAQRTVRDLRTDLFDRLQELPLRFFDSRPHGDLMSRLTNDVEMINTVLSESVTQLVAGLLSLVAIAAVMLWLNPLLALITLLTTPVLMTLLTRLVVGRTRTAFRAQQNTLGALNGLIEETIGGQRVVKAYGQEAKVMASFDAANQAYRSAATRAQIFAGFMGPLTNFVNNIGLAILGGVGGWLVIQGMATVGTLASFINYSRQFGRPLNEIANLFNTIQGAVAGAERVFALIDETPERQEAAAPLIQVGGEVSFEEVSFAYTSDAPVLKQVSLHARPGQTIALVGPTGAGKTTIVNLLTRFYDIDAGRILIDGVDIRTIDRYALRRQLGIVLQDTYLFSWHCAREYPLRPARRHRRRSPRRRPPGERRAVHPSPAAQLRHAALRARQQLEPGAAPVARHRPRHPRRPAHPDPGRGDEQRRYAHRAANPGGDAAADAGAHQLRDRPPPEHDPQRRPDSGAARWRHRRTRDARRTAGAARLLPCVVHKPVSRARRSDGASCVGIIHNDTDFCIPFVGS